MIILFSLFYCSFFILISGQDVTQPLSPALDKVTVDPYTGFAYMSWLPGGSPDVGSYVIYTYSNSTAFAIDTIVSPYITDYTHTVSAARYMSVTYVVAAMDSSLNISPLSNSLSTIYLTAVNDTCHGRINLTWTAYSNDAHPATGYGIYLSVDGAPVTLHQTVPPVSASYILNGYTPDTEYCFYVVALGNSVELSASNMQCVTSGSEGAPAWTEVVAVAVEDKKMIITGSYDPGSDIHRFKAERLTGASGSWVTIEVAQGISGSVIMSDQASDTTRITLFRISALSNCGTAVTASPPVRNIVLSSLREGTDVVLHWNNPFPPEPALFTVWRNTGQGYEEIASGLSDTLYTDDYRAFASLVSAGEVVYYVTATRSDAPAGITVCRSSATVVRAVENIFVANAFTPNDDGLNDSFAPVLSFTPLTYEFTVYNRLGVMLFRTTSHGKGWDGRHSGTPMPAGAYLWSLRLTTPSGHTEQRSGTVTILP